MTRQQTIEREIAKMRVANLLGDDDAPLERLLADIGRAETKDIDAAVDQAVFGEPRGAVVPLVKGGQGSTTQDVRTMADYIVLFFLVCGPAFIGLVVWAIVESFL